MIDPELIVEMGDGTFGVNCPVTHYDPRSQSVLPNPQKASLRLYSNGGSYLHCKRCKADGQRVRDRAKKTIDNQAQNDPHYSS